MKFLPHTLLKKNCLLKTKSGILSWQILNGSKAKILSTFEIQLYFSLIFAPLLSIRNIYTETIT
jgi:hypothetical protein